MYIHAIKGLNVSKVNIWGTVPLLLFFIWQPPWGLKKYQYKTVKCCLYLHIKGYWSEIYNIYSMITSYKWLIKKNVIKIRYCFMANHGFPVIWPSCFACLSWLMLFLRTWWMAKTMNNVSWLMLFLRRWCMAKTMNNVLFYCYILSVFTYVCILLYFSRLSRWDGGS